MVEDPPEARFLPGVTENLSRIARQLSSVAIITGRPAEFVVQHFAGSKDSSRRDRSPGQARAARPSARGVRVVGHYGLERCSVDGDAVGAVEVHVPPGADEQAIREDVSLLAGTLEEARSSDGAPGGIWIEDKGLSVTVHWRRSPFPEAARAWAETSIARALGGLSLTGSFELCPGRRSLECCPSLGIDKGRAVMELARGLDVVVYGGDDLGDLPAFDALDSLAATGTTAFRIAVASPEAPEELLIRSDLVLDGVEAMGRWLASLARALER